jgi:hypothetical protein
LLKRSEADQWELAELSWEQTQQGVTQEQWAKDIETTQQHVSCLVRIAKKYNQVVDRPTFANAYAEAKGLPVDRVERREMEATKRIKAMEPEQQVGLVLDLLPVLPAESVKEIVKTAKAVLKVQEDSEESAEDEEAEEEAGAEAGPDSFMRFLGDMLSAGSYLKSAQAKLTDLAPVEGEQEAVTTEQVHRRRVQLDWIESTASGGAKPSDAELQALLGEGSR